MAKKNYTPSPNGQSAEDRALDIFANAMIEKIQHIQSDWKQPWFSGKTSQLPQNLNGRPYNGMNSVILMLMQEKHGWETSRYATFDRISSLNYTKDTEGKRHPILDADGNKLPLVSVKKGEKSTPVMITTFTVVDQDTKERIKYDDYKQMSEEERKKYNVYPKLQVYNVFNIAQTNLKESRPEMYEKYLAEAEGRRNGSAEGMKDFPALDAMIEKDLYVCPIKPTFGNDAYYSIANDVIIVPEKSQFVDGESFYSNLLHEMSHASGSENRLNRIKPDAGFGSAEYAREELVAELTAALVSSQNGMEKHIKTDSAAYLKGWLNSLRESPDFIKTTLMDVKRSSSFISKRLEAVGEKLEKDGWNADFSEIRQQNKTFSPAFDRSQTALPRPQAQQPEESLQEKTEQNQQEQSVAKSTERSGFHR